MGKISDTRREKELIGLFLLSRKSIDKAIDMHFNYQECVDEFNQDIIKIILERATYDSDFIPSIPFILDSIEFEDEKDKRDTMLKLNRYKKMIQKEIVDNSQYDDIIDNNINKLRDYSIKRKVINVLKNGLEEIDLSSREFISLIQKGLNDIEINDGLIAEVSIHTGFQELKKEMEYLKENDVSFGFKFGLRDFDAMTQDQISKGSLSYIVGRPSNYKTGTALNLAQNAAEKGTPTALFSNEMKVNDVYRRILSRITGIPMSKLKKPKELLEEDWLLLDEAITKVESWPLYVIDSAMLNIGQIDSMVGYLKGKYGIELFFQDYFQLIRTRKGNIPNEEWEYGNNSEELRMIAKNHNVALIVLSQANRGCEQRDDKRPTMKDIRSTGKAEQDAHNIFYVYRDEFYNLSKSEMPNHMEIGALKIREGELRRAIFHFNGAKATIGDCDPLVVIDKPREYIGGGGSVA